MNSYDFGERSWVHWSAIAKAHGTQSPQSDLGSSHCVQLQQELKVRNRRLVGQTAAAHDLRQRSRVRLQVRDRFCPLGVGARNQQHMTEMVRIAKVAGYRVGLPGRVTQGGRNIPLRFAAPGMEVLDDLLPRGRVEEQAEVQMVTVVENPGFGPRTAQKGVRRLGRIENSSARCLRSRLELLQMCLCQIRLLQLQIETCQ